MRKFYLVIFPFLILGGKITAQITQTKPDPVDIQAYYWPSNTLVPSALKDVNPDDTLFRALSLSGQKPREDRFSPGSLNTNRQWRSPGNYPLLFGRKHSLSEAIPSCQRIKIDSIEYFEPVMVPVCDSIHSEIFEYKLNDKGYTVEYIPKAYDKNTGEWKYGVRQVFEVDDEGVLLVKYEYKWSGSDWQNVARTTYDRDTISRLNTTSVDNWNAAEGAWFAVSRTETRFNEKGRILSTKIYDLVKFGGDVVASKTEYTLNENGQLTSLLNCSNWNPELQTWSNQTRTDYAYNDKGERTLLAQFRYIVADNLWLNNSKIETVYWEDGSIQDSYYNLNSQTNELDLVNQIFYKIEKEYEGDKLVQETRWEKLSESLWHITSQKDYQYNQLGLVTYYAVKVPLWGGDYLEIYEEQIKDYDANGYILKDERYIWDNQNYRLKGNTFVEYTRKPDGKTLTYIRYKWNNENFSWDIDIKDFFTYDGELSFTINRYSFFPTGSQVILEKADETTILGYNQESGRYVSLTAENFAVSISYNTNLRVDEVIHQDTYYPEDNQKITFTYDDHQRYLMWNYYRQFEDKWIFRYSIEYTYQKLSNGNLWIKEEIYSDFPKKNNYYYDGDRLLALSGFEYDSDNKKWMLQDSIVFLYSDKGQIYKVLGVNQWGERIDEFVPEGNTVKLYHRHRNTEYQSEWITDHYTVLEVDTSYSKGQIQELPAAIFWDGLYGSVEFNLYFEYGRVNSISEFDRVEETGEYIQYSQIKIHYSPAAILSGEGMVSGLIYSTPGTEKSVSIYAGQAEEPVAGALVKLAAREDDFILGADTTGVDGVYSFKGIPDGLYYLVVELEGHPQKSTYEIHVTTDSCIFNNRNFIVTDSEIFTYVQNIQFDIKIYPNPALDYLYIQSPVEITGCRMFSAEGRLVYMSENQTFFNYTIPTGNLAGGIYLLKLKAGQNIFSTKLLVNRK